MAMDYAAFLQAKRHAGEGVGFEPTFMPEALYDFQRALVAWAVRKGRAAVFADCGLGKTPMQLAWAQNVVERTNRPVLVLTPLAVGQQTVQEGIKFGIACERSNGAVPRGAGILVTNYEQLHHFDPAAFAGVVCDESSILKAFDGATRQQITRFMRRLPYRLLCTATAAPNDWFELGTSSEALGWLGYMDMLNRFFRNDQNNSATGNLWGQTVQWRLKHHAEEPFWRWVCAWARAVRRPSDLGFPDGDFRLPALGIHERIIERAAPPEGALFSLPATTLAEQRAERRETIAERCEAVVTYVAEHDCSLVWCHLNDEADRLERAIPGAVQVKGSEATEAKEEKLLAFANGDVPVLVTKPTIAGFGMNFQRCAHMTFFPSHSYEQFYQAVRRCWRFGQVRPVTVDVVATEGERGVLDNLQRKAEQADRMFDRLVVHMNEALDVAPAGPGAQPVEVPAWL